MRNKGKIISIALFMALCGCNNKDICHNEIHLQNESLIDYDWAIADSHDGSRGVILTITDENGNETKITTSEDGTVVELPDGNYLINAGEEVDHITYDKNEVKVEVDNSNHVTEPPPFNAGESTLVVSKGKTEGSTVPMIPQTRELVIIIHILSGTQYFKNIEQFPAILEGVTMTRDMLMGFPPTPSPGRELTTPTYGMLALDFTKHETEEGIGYSYISRHRLLGIGSDNNKSLKINSLTENDPDPDSPLLTYSLTHIITDFHTYEPINEPYVLILELTGNDITGKFTISDWAIGDGHDLIAEEQ